MLCDRRFPSILAEIPSGKRDVCVGQSSFLVLHPSFLQLSCPSILQIAVTACSSVAGVRFAACMQVFAQPVFETIENGIAKRRPAWAGHIPRLRFLWRGAYVVLTATLAIVIPFFQALMGLVGKLLHRHSSSLPLSACGKRE